MKDKDISVFFYGLFMDTDLLKSIGLSPSLHKVDKLKDYKIVLSTRATLNPYLNETVWGTIIKLSQIDLKKLYSSPSVIDYKPVSVTMESGTKASVYILPVNIKLKSPENSEYAKKLKLTALKLRLPEEYIQKLDNIITMIDEKKYSC